MSLETRLRNTGQQGGAGGGSSNSAGLAGLANHYVTTSDDTTKLTNSLVLQPGSSVTSHVTGSNIYINAITNSLASSSGLATNAAVYILSSINANLANALIIQPGSSVTSHITGSNIYINAITSGGASTTPGTYQIQPQQAKLYASNSAARIDAGTPFFRLLFSAVTQQYGLWQFIVPADYSSNPYVRVFYGADSSISVARSISWIIDQWGIAANQGRAGGYYIDTFGGTNTVSIALSAGYSSGSIQVLTVPLATTVSFSASRLINLRISASGGVMGNSEMIGGSLEYTKI